MCYNYHVVSGVYYSTYPFETPAGVAASAGFFYLLTIISHFCIDKKNVRSVLYKYKKIQEVRVIELQTDDCGAVGQTDRQTAPRVIPLYLGYHQRLTVLYRQLFLCPPAAAGISRRMLPDGLKVRRASRRACCKGAGGKILAGNGII